MYQQRAVAKSKRFKSGRPGPHLHCPAFSLWPLGKSLKLSGPVRPLWWRCSSILHRNLGRTSKIRDPNTQCSQWWLIRFLLYDVSNYSPVSRQQGSFSHQKQSVTVSNTRELLPCPPHSCGPSQQQHRLPWASPQPSSVSLGVQITRTPPMPCHAPPALASCRRIEEEKADRQTWILISACSTDHLWAQLIRPGWTCDPKRSRQILS